MNFLKILASYTAVMASVATADTCPVAPSRIIMDVTAKVSFDAKTKLFAYSYTIMNDRSSPLAATILRLQIDKEPVQITSPPKWDSNFDEFKNDVTFFWATGSKLPPGHSLNGFSFKSPYPPGNVKYFTYGDADVPTSEASDVSDEPIPDCPDFFFGRKGAHASDVVGVTIGPVSDGSLSPEMKMFRGEFADRGWEKEDHPQIKFKERGRLKVMLLGSDKFDPAKVDTKTIQFGPNKVAQISSKIIGDIRSGKEKKDKANHGALMLEFAIEDLGVTCNIDHALFISGKMLDGKKFFTGAPLRSEACTKEHFKDKPHHKTENSNDD